MVQPVEQLTDRISAYQLDRAAVDVPAMVDRAQTRLLVLRRQALFPAFRFGGWNEDYPSLRSFPFRKQYRSYTSNGERVYPFEPNTGAINILTDQLTVSELGSFFTPLRVRKQGDFTELRGLTYYVGLDHSRSTPAEKLEVMTADVKEGLDIIASADRRSLGAVDYLLYLGVLDHFKSHSLAAFHALTFHEREGFIPDDADYLPVRRKAQKLMSAMTRVYYQACLGQSFDVQFDPAESKKSMEEVADYIANSGHSKEHFTLPEVINPIIIMLGAHEAARKKPYPDTIIGIPSGGTEVTVVTALMYENLFPQCGPLDMAFVPLSFHYRSQGGISTGRLAEMLVQLSNVAGKQVLIADDNSNSGSTLQRMADAALYAGASSVAVHIAEIDPGRLMVNAKKENVAAFGIPKVVNMDHPDFETAMGISGASDQDGGDSRRRELSKFVREKHKLVKKRI